MKMKTIVGLYDDMNTANQVVQALVNYGIDRDEVSLISGDRKGTYGSNGSQVGDRNEWDNTRTTDTGSAAAGGAVTGAVVGGVGGALLSLTALAIPGIGPVIAAGPLVAGLVGAGAGAAVGGLLGALTEVGVPEEEAGYYVEGVHRGGTLVSVKTDDAETDQVVDIMNRYNPIDVKERAATWRSEDRPDYGDSATSTATGRMDQDSDRFATQTMAGQAATSNYDRTATDRTPANNAADNRATYDRNSYAAKTNGGEEEARVPIVEEDVQIGKREVERGGVRVRKSVEEQPVEKQVNLREENVNVERRPVNRAADAADLNTFEEGDFEVSSMTEEPVVQKQARVVEEVLINKDARERTETVRDTARKTRVDVDQTDGNSSSYDASSFRNHFQTNYANRGRAYEQYEPAYRYGYTLANDARYRGRDWNAIEADAKRDWSQNHKGSAWEDFKDAVRYSWERAKDAVTS